MQGRYPRPAQLRQWRERWPRANIGVACGGVAKLLVVDVDDSGGEGTLSHLEAEHGALPPSVEVITGNGRHVWLRTPEGVTLGNTAGTLGEGVDTRGTGGYVLAPPSLHPSGAATAGRSTPRTLSPTRPPG